MTYMHLFIESVQNDATNIKAYTVRNKMATEDEGGPWTLVGPKRKGIKIRHEISPVFCQYESELWNSYFKALTGIDIGFKLTQHSFPYFSPLECRRNLDVVLQTLFSKRPIVLDLTCGSGSDSIAFLMNLDPEQLFCVDSMSDEDFAVALENMQTYVDAFPEIYDRIKIMKSGDSELIWQQRISMHRLRASDFLRKFAKYLKTRPNWLNDEILGYFDPPWDARYLPGLSDEEYKNIVTEYGERKNVEYEVSPKILFDYIQNHILKPMLETGIAFSVFCVKVRWEMTPDKMQQYLDLNPDVGQHFVVLYSVQALPFVKNANLGQKDGMPIIVDKQNGNRVPRKGKAYGAVKGQFHWIVMKNTKYTHSADQRSWWYKKWIEHDTTPIYVKKGSEVKPHTPLYESKLPYPTVISARAYGELQDENKTSTYTQIGPLPDITVVQANDIRYFIEELEKIKTTLPSDGIRADLIAKVQELVEDCEDYEEATKWTSPDAQTLRGLVKEMKSLLQRSSTKTQDTSGAKSGETADEGWQVVKGRGPNKSLAHLLRQLHDLKSVL